MAIDYATILATVTRLINENGRAIRLVEKDVTLADASKPWNGTRTPSTPTPYGELVNGVMMDTISSRYLGLTIQEKDGIHAERKYFVVSASVSIEPIEKWFAIVDTMYNEMWKIEASNVLQPGDTRLLVAFQVAKRELYT